MRIATCRCGALTAHCDGDPVRISVCHCLNCQRRSGSSFAAQARFPDDAVRIDGASHIYREAGDSGAVATFHFCPNCGAVIAYRNEGMEGLVAIPIGAFTDPDFPPPDYSVYEGRKHRWVAIVGDDIDHID